MCAAHAAVRSLLAELINEYERPALIDLEAGLEHLSRGTARHADTVLVVLEPYFKSMETAARLTELGRELGISRVYAVANKTRSEDDVRAIRDFCEAREMQLAAIVPEDEKILEADRSGLAPLDHSQASPAIQAIERLLQELLK